MIRADKDTEDLSSIVLVDKDNFYFKAEAVIRIGQKLDYPYNVAAVCGKLTPPFMRRRIYDFISKNRHKFGVIEDSCRLFDDKFDGRFVRDPEPEEEEKNA